MQMHPSWNFSRRDKDGAWAFSKERAHSEFWDSILPRIISLESQTWSNILIESKKSNHSIPIADLNKCATDRLRYLGVDQESLVSISIDGTHRLYGFLSGSTYVLLWYDDDHGDNNTCVCRCVKKHT